ncbi:OB-fold protein [Pandoraea communis]|uniref:OB-fold protein n=1 Tax=Pandoraea communis TaxID=2508297 RepID=UPI0026703DC8|nr:hypothetical protein [Pandoraea communis]
MVSFLITPLLSWIILLCLKDLRPSDSPKKANWPLGVAAIVLSVGWIVAIAVYVAATPAPYSDAEADAASAPRTSEVKSAQAPVQQTYMKVSLSKLAEDYEANEVAADIKYKGKLLEITGRVQSIDKDAFDGISIALATSNEFMPARASVDKSLEATAAQLTKGQTITVRCKGGGLLVGSPILRNCQIG